MTIQWEIRQGDALELLREIPDASVDSVVTDPPYGERNAAWDAPRSREWHEAWITEAHRVLKPFAPLICFCSRRYVDIVMGAMRSVRGDDPRAPLQSGAWVHRQGFTSAPGMLRPEHEPFIVSGLLRVDSDDVRALRRYQTAHNIARKPTRRSPNDRLHFGPYVYVPHEAGPVAGTVIECARNTPAEAVGHPTQKPEGAVEILVAASCATGGLVLDPFTGSGTVGVVALRHGRRFLGMELDGDYCAMARRRIAGPLFAGLGA